MLAEAIQLQTPNFFTDSYVLAKAAAAVSIFTAPGHWEIRPQIAAIKANPSFQASRIAHIHRSANYKAYLQARLAKKNQSRSLAIRCLSSDIGHVQVRMCFQNQRDSFYTPLCKIFLR
jgi:hypothetical protein